MSARLPTVGGDQNNWGQLLNDYLAVDHDATGKNVYTQAGAGAVARAVDDKFGESISVKDFGAIGNGVADDTAAIQAGIDYVNSDIYRSELYFPSGVYRVSQLIAKTGVTLRGEGGNARQGGHSTARIQSLAASTSDSLIYSSDATLYDFRIIGLYIIGRSNSVDHRGVDLANLSSGCITNCRFELFGGQAINVAAGTYSIFEDIYAVNCGGFVKTSGAKGVVDLSGNEFFMTRCEISGSFGGIGSGSVASSNLYNCCVVIRGSDNWLLNVFAEFGDVGFFITGTGQGNHHLIGCHADNMPGNGFWLDSGVSKTLFLGCKAFRCGHSTNNAYYGFRLDGFSSTCDACYVTGVSDGARVKYGFYNVCASGTGTGANTITQSCKSDDHVTQGLVDQNGNTRMNYVPHYRYKRTVVAVASPSIDQSAWIELSATSPINVTSFSNVVPTQEFRLTFADTNVTLVAGTLLTLPEGVATLLCTTNTVLHGFVKDGNFTSQGVILSGTAAGSAALSSSATYDPPSLATGVLDAAQTITVADAALGDRVDATFSNDLSGVELNAWVSAANTVKYQFFNRTGGSVDLASGTVKVWVRK